MGFSYNKIKNVIELIVSEERIKEKIYISGGSVPWIISNKDSNREHGDIDIICKKENMELIRNLLKENNIYHEELDSLNYEQNHEKKDYGVDTIIRGVPVGFYPFEYKDGVIIQRSFSPKAFYGKIELKEKIIEGLNIEDYVTVVELENGQKIGITTLEVLKATKSTLLRGKDISDIKQINKIGINSEKYGKVNRAIMKMYTTLEEGKETSCSKNEEQDKIMQERA